jgi:hypothetical protein
VFPYILAFTRNTIEIRLVVNGTLVHTLVLPKVHLISAKVSRAFVTVDAIEVLIKSIHFLKLINSYEFKFLFTSCAFPVGQSVLKRNLIGSSRSNRKLINFLSNELINLRKGISAIFYQHFHCIDSNS